MYNIISFFFKLRTWKLRPVCKRMALSCNEGSGSRHQRFQQRHHKIRQISTDHHMSRCHLKRGPTVNPSDTTARIKTIKTHKYVKGLDSRFGHSLSVNIQVEHRKLLFGSHEQPAGEFGCYGTGLWFLRPGEFGGPEVPG